MVFSLLCKTASRWISVFCTAMLPHLATLQFSPWLCCTSLQARCTFGAAGCVRRLPCYAVCTIGGYCDLTDLANRTVGMPKARGIAKLPGRHGRQNGRACWFGANQKDNHGRWHHFPRQIFGPAALRAVAAAHASCNVGHIEMASETRHIKAASLG